MINNVMFKKNLLPQKNAFFTLLRHFNNFEGINIDNINHRLDEYKKYDIQKDKELYYYMMIKKVNDDIFKKKITLDEGVYILINLVDPELDMIKIYEYESKIDTIKLKSKLKIGFFDEKLLKYEEVYVEKFLDSDVYFFAKKLELK